MKKIIKVLFFIFIYCGDVKVNADTVYLPKDCWGRTQPCAVENATNGRLSLTMKSTQIHLGSEAVIQAESESMADLTRGTLLAHHDTEFRWHTPFGDVICNNCEVILERSANSLEVNTLKGDVSVIRKGDGTSYSLPPGFSVRLLTVTTAGQADLDFPQSPPFLPLAKTWAKIYPGSKPEFKKELNAYYNTWQTAATLSSQMETTEATRQVASADSAKDRQERAQKAREAEDKRLRALFRSKNDL